MRGMRKPLLIIACLMLAITALSSPIGKTMGEVLNIPIQNPEDQPGGRPRSLPIFSASLDVDLNILSISSIYNVGEVDVVIENLTTGEYVEDSFNSSIPALFPISGNSGLWTITLSLESGEEYHGIFEI